MALHHSLNARLMFGSPRLLRLGLQGLALGGVAWASLQLALLVAQLRFDARTGHPASTGQLGQGVVLLLLVGAAVWLYGRSDRLAAGMWRAARRRRAI